MELFTFDDLSEEAKQYALRVIRHTVKDEIKRKVTEAREAYQKDANTAINDPYHISRITFVNCTFHRLRDDRYLIDYIKQNLCMFSRDGKFYSYTQKKFIDLH